MVMSLLEVYLKLLRYFHFILQRSKRELKKNACVCSHTNRVVDGNNAVSKVHGIRCECFNVEMFFFLFILQRIVIEISRMEDIL